MRFMDKRGSILKAAVLKDYEQLVTIEDVELHAPKKRRGSREDERSRYFP